MPLPHEDYVNLANRIAAKLGVKPSEIQFNFCLEDKQRFILSPSKNEVAVGDIQDVLNNEDHKDPLKLQEYKESLLARGRSFCAAARKFFEDYGFKDRDKQIENVNKLENEFSLLFKDKAHNENEQYHAIYDALGEELKKLVKNAKYKTPREKIERLFRNTTEKDLVDEEALVNTDRHRKIHVTVSGDLSKLTAQVEKPRECFSHLSKEQQLEYLLVYASMPRSKNGGIDHIVYSLKKNGYEHLTDAFITRYLQYQERNELPACFKKMPEWKKNRLARSMAKLVNEGIDIPIATPATLADRPGLRNAFVSSVMLLKYDRKQGTVETLRTTQPSIRCSAPIVNTESGVKEFLAFLGFRTRDTKEEQLNVLQAIAIIENEQKNNKTLPWDDPPEGSYKKVVFWQSLLKDTKFSYVEYQALRKKEAAISALKKNKEFSAAYNIGHSNHNVTGGKIFRRILNFFNRNLLRPHTNETMEKIASLRTAVSTFFNHRVKRKPRKDFIVRKLDEMLQKEDKNYNTLPQDVKENKRKEAYEKFSDALHGAFNSYWNKEIESLYEKAFFGQLEDNDLDRIFTLLDSSLEQQKTLKLVLNAINSYMKENTNSRKFGNNRQLHLGALEEIIVAESGNIFISHCKSGKDREAALKAYKCALIEFFEKNGRIYTLDDGPGARREFIEFFIASFVTNHHARLSELNSQGSEGLKSLKGVLPQDIYAELEKNFSLLMSQHKNNAELNKLGEGKVTPDKDILRKATITLGNALKPTENQNEHDTPNTSVAKVAVTLAGGDKREACRQLSKKEEEVKREFAREAPNQAIDQEPFSSRTPEPRDVTSLSTPRP